jgi:hypothetical protein
MDKFPKPEDRQLDDRLSEFTDRVLSDKNEANSQETMAQGELAELQKTVLRMKAAAQKVRESGDAGARIRTNLMMEWKKTRQHPAPKRFIRNWTFPRLALAGGFAVLIIFSVVTLIAPSTTPLTATSNGSQIWSPIFILAGIVIIALILWHNRHD